MTAPDRRLGDTTWPQVPERPVLLVPVGSTEQHGPHLALGTDALVAEAVALGLADRIEGAIVAPALAYGASGEHADFPGTLSIGLDVLRSVLVEIGRSATLWAASVVFVNGHGGNAVAVDAATRLLVEEGRAVRWVPCAVPDADAHAGRTETSLLLTIAPALVRVERAEAGDVRPVRELLPELRASGVRAVSPNGVLGDPSGASAEEGTRILAAMIDRAAAVVRDGG
ncbi:mycofactocin biosynthesis peptidyl-dipeptidase MftE [Amnibacterium sp.]|uniref:mycofactocin biosynthesis peptidyl-dipeptidase MftE n=1 Tax=Amnibacterium sp. TaxID=1872496 RepID=UPI003F7BC69A